MDSTFGLSHALANETRARGESEQVNKESVARAKKILGKQIPPAKKLIQSKHTHDAACPPRRAGKTFCVGSLAMIVGEAKPGSVVVVMSLTLPQLRKIWWDEQTGIIRLLDKLFDLKLEYHNSFLKWTHQNGSVGYLISCEDKKRMEYVRGIEADLYVIDESQAFAPGPLRYLLDSIIEPQRRSRKARVVMIGTPGPVEAGPFYEATCERARHSKTKLPLSIAQGEKDHLRKAKEGMLWVRHHWTLEDNTALSHQWEEALAAKKAKAWPDDHPVWLRESLGQWAGSFDGLIYRYLVDKPTGSVNWVPAPPTETNPAGLPEELGPWRFIGGLDLGFEDATALVVCAYSQRARELRHVVDYSRSEQLVPDVAAMIDQAQATYGRLDVIFVDQGNLGKMIVRTLIAEHGYPLEPAGKLEKFDNIELVNAGFKAGEIKIIDGTILSDQLEIQQWLLEDGTEEDPAKQKRMLARAGKLKENPEIPNDLADAFLYCYRGSQHYFATAKKAEKVPDAGTPEWELHRREEELRKYRARPDESPQSRALAGRVRVPNFLKSAFAPWKLKASLSSKLS